MIFGTGSSSLRTISSLLKRTGSWSVASQQSEVHHWGQTRVETLLRDYCPALFALLPARGQALLERVRRP